MADWNPWHGCHKYSEGCANCYIYRMDARYGRDSSAVTKTKDFDLPLRTKKDGSYQLQIGCRVYTCFSSDFFVEDADAWRAEAWEMMRQRSDLRFLFITKRIERMPLALPDDWGDGYDNVTICCTVENQRRADERLPLYLEAPVKHKIIICEPLLGQIDLKKYLGPWIEKLVAGGESGTQARPCQYDWVLSLRQQCDEKGVGFYFKQTGARFVKDGKQYQVPRKEQARQAHKAGIDTAVLDE